MYNQQLLLNTEKSRFDASTPKALWDAVDCLCLFSYEKFKARVMRLSDYEMVKMSDTHIVIRSKKYVDALPRNCYKDNDSGYFCCNSCSGCIAFEEQC